MNRQDQQAYRRAVGAALLGLGVQAIVAIGLLLLALWSGSGSDSAHWGTAAIWAATWHALGGLGIWVCLAILYQQHKLQAIEALEAEQIAQRHGTDSSIFQTTADDLAVAAKRLAWLYRWVVPITSLGTAVYLIAVGGWLIHVNVAELSPRTASPLPLQPGIAMAVSIGLAFVAFLISRYIAGMAKSPQWQVLRGGAGYLMGSVLMGALLAVGLGFVFRETPLPIRILAIVFPAMMVIVGIEVTLNFILDAYRPRRAGEVPRPAFDSRLLSLLTSPESIAKTINEAVNYQFGFEITRSWFWQLFSRAFGWLVVFGAAVLILFSSVVIVEPNQAALVLRFGRLTGGPLGPGMHVKLPWPIATARYYDVTTVRQMAVGSKEKHTPEQPILWATPHSTVKPDNLIVAAPSLTRRTAEPSPDSAGGERGKPLFVAVVNAEITVLYRIDPQHLLDYVRTSADADLQVDPDGLDLLREVATQEVSRALLRSDIDAWIGPERGPAGVELKKDIQAAADARHLGVRILGVELESVHPPQEAAEAFHEVVAAQLERQTAIEKAKQDATKTLVSTAGSTATANGIMQQIQKLDDLKGTRGPDDPQVVKQSAELERMLLGAGGDAAVEVAAARGYRWDRENSERGKAERFTKQLQAYRLSPEYYKASKFYDVLAEGLASARKYLLVGDHGNLTIRADLKDTSNALEGAMTVIQDKTKK